MAKLTPAQIKAQNRARLRAERMEEVRYAQANPEFAAEERRIREYNKAGAQPAAPKSTGKKLEEKEHYKWVQAEVNVLQPENGLVDLQEGEVSAFLIIKLEMLAAMQVHQPVLRRDETVKRDRFFETEKQLLQVAVSMGREAAFDKEGYLLQMGEELNWGSELNASTTTKRFREANLHFGAVVPSSDAATYHDVVRPLVRKFVLDNFNCKVR